MSEPHDRSETESPTKDEIHRKVGQNLLLFQQAERRLKALASMRRISGIGSVILDAAEQLRERVSKETLGAVVRRATEGFGEASIPEQQKIETAVLETGGIHIQMDCGFSGPDGEPDVEWQRQLEELVEARNELVHHFLEQFDLKDDNQRVQASVYLDQQYDRYVSVNDDLLRRCKAIAEGRKLLAAALSHDSIKAEFLHGHLRPTLEDLLKKVAAGKSQVNGWTCLSLAGQILASESPWLLEQLEEAFGHRGLKQAVAAMDSWELRDEPTKNGFRTLYRSREPTCATTS